MTKKIFSLSLVALLAVFAACSSDRVEEADGTVILTISMFDGLPIRVSVNANDLVQVGEFELSNVPRNPTATTSALQNIELESYEVTFTRADIGTRLPPMRVSGIFGNVPVNGTNTIDNLNVMGLDQLRNPPLSDLLFINGGLDTETGADTIQLNLNVRFFGRTLAGDRIASNTASFAIEFVQ